MLRHDTTTDIDFGLVHALHLAESGRTIQEKRIGQSLLSNLWHKAYMDRISVPPRTLEARTRAVIDAYQHNPKGSSALQLPLIPRI
jgi:hypothetical protein